MKKRKIVFREAAVDDLEDIWFYTFQNWSQEQADRYHELIYKEIEFLSKKPAAGKDMSYLREGYRSSKVKAHHIFYRYSSVELEVIRILHESMDIPNRLNE